MNGGEKRNLHIMLVAGETSGDALGGELMTAMKEMAGPLHFSGVGGPRMEGEGLTSLFPMSDIPAKSFRAFL